MLNWASEASPTLGCSIEISRDICMLVCLWETIGKIGMQKRHGQNYVAQTCARSKSVLGG